MKKVYAILNYTEQTNKKLKTAADDGGDKKRRQYRQQKKKKFIGTSAAANDQSRSSRDKIIKQKNRPNNKINQQCRPRGC